MKKGFITSEPFLMISSLLQMNEDLVPFTTSSSDLNGLLTTAPVIRHTEVHGPVFSNTTDPKKVCCFCYIRPVSA